MRIAIISLATLLLFCGSARTEPPRAFTLQCYGMGDKPALCLDESDLSSVPKCPAAAVKTWRSETADLDQRLAALPARTCVMSTDTGKYLCAQYEGCRRYHPQEYRATKVPRD